MMFKNKFILISLTFFFSCTSNKLIYNKYESKKGNYFNISIEENNMFQSDNNKTQELLFLDF